MSETQQNVLEQFRTEISTSNLTEDPRWLEEVLLLRFLRARKFDFKKTLLMYTNFLNWRIEFGTDEIQVSVIIYLLFNREPLPFQKETKLEKFTLMGTIKRANL